MIISLTGFMGCGKSSVGRRLSELLCCRFMDLDDVIENEQERTIPEIFATDGEAAFRAMELAALKTIINKYSYSTDGNLVLALGGGTIMTPECAGLIHAHTCCIYLNASAETLVNRLKGEAAGRPMLQSPAGTAQSDSDVLLARISDLMALRTSAYESIAHSIIDTEGKNIDEIAGLCISVCK